VLITDADGEGIKVHPALSINGDGMNEFLTIDGIKDFPLNKVTIINRTGIKVFDVEGYDNDQHVFTGKSKSGTLLPQGTYFALVEYNVDSKVKRKTGYFILKY
jgi:gliding motility-associated-like protein